MSGVPWQSGRVSGLDLATCPAPAASGIQRSVGHLRYRHSAESLDIPAGPGTAHRVTGFSDEMLRPRAYAGAAADSSGVDMSEPLELQGGSYNWVIVLTS